MSSSLIKNNIPLHFELQPKCVIPLKRGVKQRDKNERPDRRARPPL